MVRHISSSGPRIRSVRCACCPCSTLVTIRSVMSGASMLRPRLLAYFFNIISRTSSTKSSSLICTRVAEAPGRRTHTFLCNTQVMSGRSGVKWSTAADVCRVVLTRWCRSDARSAGKSTRVFTTVPLALSAMLCSRETAFSAGCARGETERVDAALEREQSTATPSSSPALCPCSSI